MNFKNVAAGFLATFVMASILGADLDAYLKVLGICVIAAALFLFLRKNW
jgi:hypothetical protein